MRQQQDNKFYQLQHSAKKLWEKLRRSDVRSEERNQLALELHQLLKGNIVNIVEAHDTSRVVECLYTNGNHDIKNSVFDEVKASQASFSADRTQRLSLSCSPTSLFLSCCIYLSVSVSVSLSSDGERRITRTDPTETRASALYTMR